MKMKMNVATRKRRIVKFQVNTAIFFTTNKKQLYVSTTVFNKVDNKQLTTNIEDNYCPYKMNNTLININRE